MEIKRENANRFSTLAVVLSRLNKYERIPTIIKKTQQLRTRIETKEKKK
tara:strand:+ start:123 stop:269 length:147 start_codon:yes stop_codon:yes gene_type:complete